jgi:phenylacetate-CoA ligase
MRHEDEPGRPVNPEDRMNSNTDAVVLQPRTADELRDVFARLRKAGAQLAQLSLDSLLQPLDALARMWQPGSAWHRQACDCLAGAFTQRAVEASLQGLALGLTRPVLLAELQRELGRADLLDRWQPDEWSIGHARGFPLGVVAQVLAGNVFLGGVTALAQSLLTRNAVLLKLSREDSGFTALFIQALRQADSAGVVSAALAACSWSSEQEPLNEVVRQEADAVVVWGGESAVAAYPAERCGGRVIHYGPRLGIGVVLAGVELSQALPALAWDVALWEQKACSSPRVVLVEDADGSGALPREVAHGLSRALTAVRSALPPRKLSLDEKAEALTIREIAWWREQVQVVTTEPGLDRTVLLAREPPLDVPLGHRTVVVAPLPGLDHLSQLLAPYRGGLQTVTLAAPPDRWSAAVSALVSAGMTQVSAAGAAAARLLGLPHEGEYSLRRLVRLVGIDLGVGPLTYPGRDPAAASAVAAALSAGQ